MREIAKHYIPQQIKPNPNSILITLSQPFQELYAQFIRIYQVQLYEKKSAIYTGGINNVKQDEIIKHVDRSKK